MPINKCLKNLLVEIILCFTIATLAGHLSTSFWERYVVHRELCNMKDNLRNLKVTVTHIGNAYDKLQNELIDLAGTRKPKRPRHDVKFSQNNLDANIAKSLNYEIIREVNNEKNWKPIEHKEKGIMSNSYKAIDNNASTITNNLSKNSSIEVKSNREPFSKTRYSCELKNSRERHEYYKPKCGCYFS